METGSVLVSLLLLQQMTRNCLKTTQIYYLMVLEIISPKIKVLAEAFFNGCSRRESASLSFPASSDYLQYLVHSPLLHLQNQHVQISF